MFQRLLAAPALLLICQAAPVAVTSDSDGRYQLSFGYGAGQYEVRHFNCAGELTDVDPVPFRTAGVRLDAWLAHRLRIAAFGGVVTETGHQHPYGGLVAAFEGQNVGFGAGAVRIARLDDRTYPSLYLRFGDIDGLHFRSDVLPPTPMHAATGVMRIGLGYNQGHVRGFRGFFGIGAAGIDLEADGEVGGGPFAELTVPVGQRFGLLLQGAWRPSETYADWGLGLGGTYEFGR